MIRGALEAAHGRYRPLLLCAWAAANVLMVLAALTPQLAPPGEYGADKLIHLTAFGALTIMPLPPGRPRWLDLGVAGTMLAVGILIEVAQSYVPGREASVYDVLADLVGILLGLAVLRGTWLLGRR